MYIRKERGVFFFYVGDLSHCEKITNICHLDVLICIQFYKFNCENLHYMHSQKDKRKKNKDHSLRTYKRRRFCLLLLLQRSKLWCRWKQLCMLRSGKNFVSLGLQSLWSWFSNRLTFFYLSCTDHMTLKKFELDKKLTQQQWFIPFTALIDKLYKL